MKIEPFKLRSGSQQRLSLALDNLRANSDSKHYYYLSPRQLENANYSYAYHKLLDQFSLLLEPHAILSERNNLGWVYYQAKKVSTKERRTIMEKDRRNRGGWESLSVNSDLESESEIRLQQSNQWQGDQREWSFQDDIQSDVYIVSLPLIDFEPTTLKAYRQGYFNDRNCVWPTEANWNNLHQDSESDRLNFVAGHSHLYDTDVMWGLKTIWKSCQYEYQVGQKHSESYSESADTDQNFLYVGKQPNRRFLVQVQFGSDDTKSQTDKIEPESLSTPQDFKVLAKIQEEFSSSFLHQVARNLKQQKMKQHENHNDSTQNHNAHDLSKQYLNFKKIEQIEKSCLWKANNNRPNQSATADSDSQVQWQQSMSLCDLDFLKKEVYTNSNFSPTLGYEIMKIKSLNIPVQFELFRLEFEVKPQQLITQGEGSRTKWASWQEFVDRYIQVQSDKESNLESKFSSTEDSDSWNNQYDSASDSLTQQYSSFINLRLAGGPSSSQSAELFELKAVTQTVTDLTKSQSSDVFQHYFQFQLCPRPSLSIPKFLEVGRMIMAIDSEQSESQWQQQYYSKLPIHLFGSSASDSDSDHHNGMSSLDTASKQDSEFGQTHYMQVLLQPQFYSENPMRQQIHAQENDNDYMWSTISEPSVNDLQSMLMIPARIMTKTQQQGLSSESKTNKTQSYSFFRNSQQQWQGQHKSQKLFKLKGPIYNSLLDSNVWEAQEPQLQNGEDSESESQYSNNYTDSESDYSYYINNYFVDKKNLKDDFCIQTQWIPGPVGNTNQNLNLSLIEQDLKLDYQDGSDVKQAGVDDSGVDVLDILDHWSGIIVLLLILLGGLFCCLALCCIIVTCIQWCVRKLLIQLNLVKKPQNSRKQQARTRTRGRLTKLTRENLALDQARQNYLRTSPEVIVTGTAVTVNTVSSESKKKRNSRLNSSYDNNYDDKDSNLNDDSVSDRSDSHSDSDESITYKSSDLTSATITISDDAKSNCNMKT